MNTLHDYYFTFGHGHAGFPGYVKITAPDADTARDAMFEKYGAKWCQQCFSLEDVHEMDRVLRDTLVWQEHRPGVVVMPWAGG